MSLRVLPARRARNVTVSALCRLHERCGEDEALRSLRIDGAPLPERLLAAIAAALEFENERHGRSLKAAAAVDAESDEDWRWRREWGGAKSRPIDFMPPRGADFGPRCPRLVEVIATAAPGICRHSLGSAPLRS